MLSASHHTMLSTSIIPKTPKVYSCILCRQRRVRCDRKQPCSNCVKAGAECKASNPAPPNRAKKGRLNDKSYTKITSHKQASKGENVEFTKLTGPGTGSIFGQASEVDGEHADTPLSTLRGKLIVEDGRPRYVDSDLWTELDDELQEPQEIQGSSSFTAKNASPVISYSGVSDGSTLLLQQSVSETPSNIPHPAPLQVFKLWQSYLDNVHPLTKLLHAPTMQHQVLEASSDPTSIPKNMEALLFAIYTLAIVSLHDAECQSMMGESKRVVFTRYASATERALVKANYIQSADFSILQAFVLLLVRLTHIYNSKRY